MGRHISLPFFPRLGLVHTVCPGPAIHPAPAGARVIALAWHKDQGERLIHLGPGYWGGETVQDELRDRTGPSFGLATAGAGACTALGVAPSVNQIVGSFSCANELTPRATP